MNNKIDVVVIGSGLTGLTLAYYLNKYGKKVLLLERNPIVGGVIHTHHKEGFTFEGGPTTGALGSEEMVELFDELKGDCEFEGTSDIAKERWILKNNKWKPIPAGLLSGIKTPLFSWKDKFRIWGEPFRKKGTNPNETLAEMVKRRLGQTYLDYAIDPFISGVYAGDPNLLIPRYALPKLYKIEQDYGSFIRGAIKKRREPKTELQKRVTREVFSVKGGLSNLIKALEKNIPSDSIQCGVENINIQPADKSYQISYSNSFGDECKVVANKVVTTVGGYALKEVLSFVKGIELDAVFNVKYAKVVQAAVGYNKWRGLPINAFGGLVPGKEKKDFLGILFPGSLFQNRCPEGGALLSVFMGGIKRPDIIEKSDEELKEIVLREISSTLGEQKTPDLLHIFRYQHAIAQYDISTEERLEVIKRVEAKYPGLILGGNIRDGIGMTDRVKQGKYIADQIVN